MLIQHRQVGKKGIFYVGQDGAIEAELVYHISPLGKMVIEHTEVGEQLAGQGVGKQLVETAVDYARKQQMKIIPLCPFARSLFQKTPEWADILE
jgi:predicted GNAT family acetyltransferase